ncbi:MAG: TonB-dependent receptor [Muribaculaceae bacterium]|nr:TonB-dependent receptor [Muribaculaceae bacterium]
MRKQLLLVAALTAATFPVGVYASGTEYSTPKEELNDSIISTELHEIEVSANRALPNTPVAMTRVGREEIAKRNDGRDMPYLLSMTPSVTVTSDAGAGIGYSGIRVRGTDASRINVMTNGVSLNDPESHVVYWVDLPDIASSVQDVQIQRGAGTSVNGAGAFGASINVVTDTPSDKPYGEVNLTYGSYNTHKETLKAGTGLLAKHWTVDARLSNIGTDGYIDRASSKLWSYLGQVGFQGGNTNLRLMAFGGKEETYMAWDYASREQMKEFGRRYNPCGAYTDSEGNPAFYPNQKDFFIQHHLQLHLLQRFGSDWRLNATLFYTRGDGHYEQLKTKRKLVEYGLVPFINADGELVKKSDLVRLKFNDNHYAGANVNGNYRHGRVDATAGFSISRYSGHHYGEVQWVRNYLGPINPLQRYYDNTGHKTDFNIFGRALVDIGAGFSGFADLQYRHINYHIDGQLDNWNPVTDALDIMHMRRKWNFFNPKVGVNFTDDEHNRAFASWSVAHREPVRDNFTDGDRMHDPRPERMFDYELGYTYSLKWLSVGVNLYYMDYKDQLVLTGQLSDTGNPLSVNVPKSYRMGVELQVAMRPVDWFEWQSNVTFSRNRIKDFTEYLYLWEESDPIERKLGDTPISFSPDVIFNNAFTFRVKGFEAILTSHLVGRQFMTNAGSTEQMLKSYFVSDLNLSYDFGKIAKLKGLKVGFAINNLFNAKYENNGYAGAGYTLEDGKPVIYRYACYAAQATTNVMASLTVNF